MKKSWGQRKERHTAHPTTHKAGPKKLTAVVRLHARNWVPLQKSMELGHELEEIAESKEASIYCPRRSVNRLFAIEINIAFAAKKRYSLRDKILPFVRSGVNTSDRRLRDAVREAEAIGVSGRTTRGYN